MRSLAPKVLHPPRKGSNGGLSVFAFLAGVGLSAPIRRPESFRSSDIHAVGASTKFSSGTSAAQPPGHVRVPQENACMIVQGGGFLPYVYHTKIACALNGS